MIMLAFRQRDHDRLIMRVKVPTIIRAPVDAFEVMKVESRTGCARLLSSRDWMRESINDTGGEHVVLTILLDGSGSADHRSVAVINVNIR